MAMTKKEQAELKELKEQLAKARALRWPVGPRPQPMTYDEIKAARMPGGMRYGKPQMVARGYFILGSGLFSGSKRVSYGCSDGYSHAPAGNVTTAQNMGTMYRTELEAWQEVQHRAVEAAASELMMIEQEIEKARAKVIQALPVEIDGLIGKTAHDA